MLLIDVDHLPTPKEESWKYTNLPRAIPKGLVAAPEEAAIIIHRIRGQNGGKAEDILFTGRDGFLQAPVLKVVLEEGAELTLIERHDGAGAYWKNMAVEIDLSAGARLEHVRIMEESAEGVMTLGTRVRLSEGAAYNGFYATGGGKLIRNEVDVRMAGAGARCALNGVTLLRGAEHADTTICIDHEEPGGVSSQFFRTVLNDRARGVFQGKVIVRKDAVKTDASQMSGALLLSEGAEMDNKPELQIYTDDVKCTHGATTGQLDDTALFYLRSRGVPEEEARALLVAAFVGGAVDRLSDESLKSIVNKKVEQWLGNPPAHSWEGGQRGAG